MYMEGDDEDNDDAYLCSVLQQFIIIQIYI